LVHGSVVKCPHGDNVHLMTEPYTSPEELERVYNLIEGVLPDTWSIDQRSECIEITWPECSREDSAIRARATNDMIDLLIDGKLETIIGDKGAIDKWIDQRIEELKGTS